MSADSRLSLKAQRQGAQSTRWPRQHLTIPISLTAELFKPQRLVRQKLCADYVKAVNQRAETFSKHSTEKSFSSEKPSFDGTKGDFFNAL